jgi:LysM repeat protein
MELKKGEVQNATEALKEINKDQKLTVEELAKANALGLKGLSDWVAKERSVYQKEPVPPTAADPYEATTDYHVKKNAYEEMKGVLDSFDSQVKSLRESYAASKEALKDASKEELGKLETAIGIAPEKKDLLAGVRPGDKVKVTLNDGGGKTSWSEGTFVKAENGRIFLMDSKGKEQDFSLASVASVTKSPAGEAKPASAEQPVAKPSDGKEAAKPAVEKAGEEKKTHEVKKGETLSKIARQYEGVTYQEIAKLNNIADPNKIVAGQKLEIPNKTKPQEAPAPATKDAKAAKA